MTLSILMNFNFLNCFFGGHFALSAITPRSAAPLRSAASLRGSRCYRGRSADTVFRECQASVFNRYGSAEGRRGQLNVSQIKIPE